MLELDMKKKSTAKNAAAAKKQPARDEPQQTWVKYNLNAREAWALEKLAEKEGVSRETAARRILNAGMTAASAVAELPAWVDPKWAAGAEERKERAKRMDEQWRNRPSLEAVGVAFADDGKELVVRVGGQAYKTLCKGAQAVNKTLGCKAVPADVFKYAVMLESVLTLPQTEMFDALVNGWFWDWNDPNHAEEIQALRKHLRAAGLLEDRGALTKKPAKKASPAKSKEGSK